MDFFVGLYMNGEPVLGVLRSPGCSNPMVAVGLRVFYARDLNRLLAKFKCTMAM